MNKFIHLYDIAISHKSIISHFSEQAMPTTAVVPDNENEEGIICLSYLTNF